MSKVEGHEQDNLRRPHSEGPPKHAPYFYVVFILNLTGMTVWNAELVPKRLELLHELVPTTATIALLVNQTSPVVAETETKYRRQPLTGSDCN
jgi:hypothetical protein